MQDRFFSCTQHKEGPCRCLKTGEAISVKEGKRREGDRSLAGSKENRSGEKAG